MKRGATVKRDCQHKKADHQHGTRSAYLHDGCRCEPCRAANAAEARHYRRQRAYGRGTRLVDAGPACDHVAKLRDLGVGSVRMSIYSGISHTNFDDLLNRKPKKVRSDTEALVLAMPLDPAAYPSNRPMSQIGTARRLRALYCQGYTGVDLGPYLGMHPHNVWILTSGKRPVKPATAERVKALYDRLWDKPRPVRNSHDRISKAQALRAVQRHGWVPAAYWDDDEIDDPNVPEPRPVETHRTMADIIAEVEWLRKGGAFYLEVPRRMGYTRDTLARKLYKAGRADLGRWIDDRAEKSGAREKVS